MDELHQNLVTATTALMDYIESANVFDRLADAGCGLYDEYRSDKFEELLNNVKKALSDLKQS